MHGVRTTGQGSLHDGKHTGANVGQYLPMRPHPDQPGRAMPMPICIKYDVPSHVSHYGPCLCDSGFARIRSLYVGSGRCDRRNIPVLSMYSEPRLARLAVCLSACLSVYLHVCYCGTLHLQEKFKFLRGFNFALPIPLHSIPVRRVYGL